MTPRIVWRRLAEADIVASALHIAADNPAAAARFIDAVDATIRVICELPGAGRLRAFEHRALAGIRSWLVTDFANYLVFYRPTEHGIEVLRVLHGARDLDALFDDGSSS